MSGGHGAPVPPPVALGPSPGEENVWNGRWSARESTPRLGPAVVNLANLVRILIAC